jgi:Coenzyme PQQ synthesis protein D (PqqD)
MIETALLGLISIWDESPPGFEMSVCYEIRNSGAFMDSNPHEMFVRSQAVVARVVAGETLVVPVRAKVGDLGSIYKFNATGTLIWKMLERPRTLSELALAVAEQYSLELAKADRDVSAFVAEMKDVGLVDVPAALPMAGD